MLSENKKEAFRAPYLEKTAEATGVIRLTVASIRLEKSERGRFVIPDGSEEGAMYKSTLSLSTRQQSDITKFSHVRKQLPTLNTLNSFPGRVGTQRKRLGQLVYCCN